MANASALIVGLTSVDSALHDGWNGTNGCWGCELDVDNMARILTEEPLKYQVKTLKTKDATHDNILGALSTAAETRGAGDIFVFYYSGHGGQQPNFDPEDPETDNKDETLVVYDRDIIDDEIHKIFTEFKSGVHIIMLSDSCNSGTNYRMRRTVSMKEEAVFRPVAKITEKAVNIKAQLIHLGGCRDGFSAAGYHEGGAFTKALCTVWNNGAFQGTLKDLHSKIYDLLKAGQKPQYNEYGPVSDAFRNQRAFTLTPKDDYIELTVVDTAATVAEISQPGEKHKYKFTAAKAGQYTVETEGRMDVVMSLYGPDSETRLIAQDDDSGSGLNAKIVEDLTPATYYVHVQHYSSDSGTGLYSIKVSRGKAATA